MESPEREFLTISEACKLLRVSPNTLRSWGAAGKIDEYRHPMNNYRLYKSKDVESVIALLQSPRKVSESSGYAGVDS